MNLSLSHRLPPTHNHNHNHSRPQTARSIGTVPSANSAANSRPLSGSATPGSVTSRHSKLQSNSNNSSTNTSNPSSRPTTASIHLNTYSTIKSRFQSQTVDSVNNNNPPSLSIDSEFEALNLYIPPPTADQALGSTIKNRRSSIINNNNNKPIIPLLTIPHTAPAATATAIDSLNDSQQWISQLTSKSHNGRVYEEFSVVPSYIPTAANLALQSELESKQRLIIGISALSDSDSNNSENNSPSYSRINSANINKQNQSVIKARPESADIWARYISDRQKAARRSQRASRKLKSMAAAAVTGIQNNKSNQSKSQSQQPAPPPSTTPRPKTVIPSAAELIESKLQRYIPGAMRKDVLNSPALKNNNRTLNAPQQVQSHSQSQSPQHQLVQQSQSNTKSSASAVAAPASALSESSSDSDDNFLDDIFSDADPHNHDYSIPLEPVNPDDIDFGRVGREVGKRVLDQGFQLPAHHLDNIQSLPLLKQVWLSSTVNSTTGVDGLTEDQFVDFLSSCSSIAKPNLLILYEKMDVNSDGHLSWYEYISYLVRELTHHWRESAGLSTHIINQQLNNIAQLMPAVQLNTARQIIIVPSIGNSLFPTSSSKYIIHCSNETIEVYDESMKFNYHLPLHSKLKIKKGGKLVQSNILDGQQESDEEFNSNQSNHHQRQQQYSSLGRPNTANNKHSGTDSDSDLDYYRNNNKSVNNNNHRSATIRPNTANNTAPSFSFNPNRFTTTTIVTPVSTNYTVTNSRPHSRSGAAQLIAAEQAKLVLRKPLAASAQFKAGNGGNPIHSNRVYTVSHASAATVSQLGAALAPHAKKFNPTALDKAVPLNSARSRTRPVPAGASAAAELYSTDRELSRRATERLLGSDFGLNYINSYSAANQLVVASADRSLRFFGLVFRQYELLRRFYVHDTVQSFIVDNFNESRELAITGSMNGLISAYDIHSKQRIAVVQAHPGSTIRKIELFPSVGLVSCSMDGRLSIIDPNQFTIQRYLGGQLSELDNIFNLPPSDSNNSTVHNGRVGHRSGVHSFSFCDNLRSIISAGYDRRLLLWDCRISSPTWTLHNHNSDIVDIVVNETANQIISVCKDKKLRIFDLRSLRAVQEEVDELNQGGGTIDADYITAVGFDKQHQILLTGGNKLSQWKIEKSPFNRLISHYDADLIHLARSNLIINIMYSQLFKQLITVSEAGNIIIYNILTGEKLFQFNSNSISNNRKPITAAALDFAGKRLLLCAANEIYMYNYNNGELLHSFNSFNTDINNNNSGGELNKILFMPQSMQPIVAIGFGSIIYRFPTLDTIKQARAIECIGHSTNTQVNSVAYRGEILVTGGESGELIAWNVESGALRQKIILNKINRKSNNNNSQLSIASSSKPSASTSPTNSTSNLFSETSSNNGNSNINNSNANGNSIPAITSLLFATVVDSNYTELLLQYRDSLTAEHSTAGIIKSNNNTVKRPVSVPTASIGTSSSHPIGGSALSASAPFASNITPINSSLILLVGTSDGTLHILNALNLSPLQSYSELMIDSISSMAIVQYSSTIQTTLTSSSNTIPSLQDYILNKNTRLNNNNPNNNQPYTAIINTRLLLSDSQNGSSVRLYQLNGINRGCPSELELIKEFSLTLPDNAGRITDLISIEDSALNQPVFISSSDSGIVRLWSADGIQLCTFGQSQSTGTIVPTNWPTLNSIFTDAADIIEATEAAEAHERANNTAVNNTNQLVKPAASVVPVVNQPTQPKLLARSNSNENLFPKELDPLQSRVARFQQASAAAAARRAELISRSNSSPLQHQHQHQQQSIKLSSSETKVNEEQQSTTISSIKSASIHNNLPSNSNSNLSDSDSDTDRPSSVPTASVNPITGISSGLVRSRKRELKKKLEAHLLLKQQKQRYSEALRTQQLTIKQNKSDSDKLLTEANSIDKSYSVRHPSYDPSTLRPNGLRTCYITSDRRLRFKLEPERPFIIPSKYQTTQLKAQQLEQRDRELRESQLTSNNNTHSGTIELLNKLNTIEAQIKLENSTRPNTRGSNKSNNNNNNLSNNNPTPQQSSLAFQRPSLIVNHTISPRLINRSSLLQNRLVSGTPLTVQSSTNNTTPTSITTSNSRNVSRPQTAATVTNTSGPYSNHFSTIGNRH